MRELKEFKLVKWSPGRGRSERIVRAFSYDLARNLYISPLPPSVIATIEPVNSEDHLDG